MLGGTLIVDLLCCSYSRSTKAAKGVGALATVWGGFLRFVEVASMQWLDGSFAWVFLGETLANFALM